MIDFDFCGANPIESLLAGLGKKVKEEQAPQQGTWAAGSICGDLYPIIAIERLSGAFTQQGHCIITVPGPGIANKDPT